jgi:hypothetical protein
MYDMRRPKQAALMAHSMEPVVADFIREEEQHPHSPLVAESEHPKAIEKIEHRQLHHFFVRRPTATLPNPMVMLAAASLIS